MVLTKTFFGAAIATASLAAGSAAAIIEAPPVGATVEFVLVSHTTNFEIVTQSGSFVPSGPPPPNAPPPAPGDRFFIRQDLSQSGAVVGFANIVCTATFNNNLLCDAIYAINGRGDLHLTALVRNGALSEPTVFDAVVNGGTFNFRGAHGDDHIVKLPNGDNQETFNLV
ncbi:MAG: hypothetical protein NVS3B12_34620 [Acidimicrobiales bacterium]